MSSRPAKREGWIPLKGSDGTYIYLSVASHSESYYLIDSNKERCQSIFTKDKWQDGELIEGYIALHIVLEASLNSLFRQLALRSLKKGIDEITVMNNIDHISFVDKTILFIYNSSFDFDAKLDQAAEYHMIIGKLRAFCEIRNQLLHGHAIATITNSKGVTSHTKARQNIDYERLVQQLNYYRSIVEGLSFYVNCLIGLGDGDKKRFIEQYLDSSFLPNDLR